MIEGIEGSGKFKPCLNNNIILTLAASETFGLPEAEYQIFPGFDVKSWTVDKSITNETSTFTPLTTWWPWWPTVNPGINTTTSKQAVLHFQKAVLYTTTTTKPTFNTTTTLEVDHKRQKDLNTTNNQRGNTTSETQRFVANHPSIEFIGETVHSFENITMTLKKLNKFKCPEEEKPSNIGPYEVPTQRDLVLFTKTTLNQMFGRYHTRALLFLDDITKATKATRDVEAKCQGDRTKYRQCVKHVSARCETITKTLTTSLELQRQDVIAFGETPICRLEDMKENPVKLIKILASEQASLEFALPGFLRLINACSVYCTHRQFKALPIQNLTDTDLVVRHLLASGKHYTRMIPDPNDTKNHEDKTARPQPHTSDLKLYNKRIKLASNETKQRKDEQSKLQLHPSVHKIIDKLMIPNLNKTKQMKAVMPKPLQRHPSVHKILDKGISTDPDETKHMKARMPNPQPKSRHLSVHSLFDEQRIIYLDKKNKNKDLTSKPQPHPSEHKLPYKRMMPNAIEIKTMKDEIPQSYPPENKLFDEQTTTYPDTTKKDETSKPQPRPHPSEHKLPYKRMMPNPIKIKKTIKLPKQ